MAKALCIQCGMEFPNDEVYQKHKSSGHKIKGTSILPTSIPESAIPTPEFIAQVQQIEQKESEVEKVSRPTVPDPTPITLTYKYIGQCPTCRNEVTTLELEIKEDYFVSAYCLNCKKQLSNKKVTKL